MKAAKEILVIVSLVLSSVGLSAQSSLYTKSGSINGNGYVYNCVIEGGLVTINNSTDEWRDLVEWFYKDGYTGPSAKDIHSILETNNWFYNKYGIGNYNFQGAIIICHEGSEYVVQISDRSQAVAFYRENGHLFEANALNQFANKDVLSQFGKIFDNIKEQGYSKQDCYDSAMSALLNLYNTGLSLYKRENKNRNFQKNSTEMNESNNNYEPSKCSE